MQYRGLLGNARMLEGQVSKVAIRLVAEDDGIYWGFGCADKVVSNVCA